MKHCVYISSERAHFMCPNMHFAIMVKIENDYDIQKIKQSLEVVQNAHPFLQSLIEEEKETGRLYYQIQESLNILVEERIECKYWQQDYDEISSLGWDVTKECLLKILTYPQRKGFRIFFIAHHLLCDGRGLLQLVEEFAQHYVKGITPPFVEEHLIESLQDLPENSDLPFISKLIIKDANRRWKKEKHKVSYDEYRKFEKDFIRTNKIAREVTTVESSELIEMQELCKRHSVSINDYLIAKMMLKEHTNKVVIAADIRNQINCYKQGAMGNYATAFSVVVKKKEKDAIALAKLVSVQITNIMSRPQKTMLVLACYLRMQPELIDAVAMATIGNFKSQAGAFVGNNMFGYGSRNGYSITNLGKMQSDVITEATFIPPASPANKKTVGVLTMNGCMKICSATLVDRGR